ncbi:hypothetical protein GCM10011365_23210 [Marinicella pacifica]|uniref:Fibronectin type-III domain-containing protein n=2 Tax=Marinicella pacifica TaxID=1171543 RepID=A0A917FR87_9GAMM|nr:hypothetical protein GCM10011365_23210 [Marinicella pacifica]
MKLKFLMTLTVLLSTSAWAAVPQAERNALVALYNSTDGANWSDNTNWLVGDPCDNSWFGIVCGTNTITEISMGSNNLVGIIPVELGNLSNLQRLNLTLNQLSGTIPKELSNLSNLNYLYLTSNRLSGSIPKELSNLSNLQSLNLSRNQLSGTIPKELGNLSNLRELSLFTNQLYGSIPVELGNLSNLYYLFLESNQLNGSIPIELGNLSDLHYLRLNSNRLSGTIPGELGNLSNLQNLNLGRNQLSGSIPVELGSLSNLQHLYLYSNQLSGSIPVELGNLSNLSWFNLNSNQLSGSIPVELGNLSNLERLFLNSNQLSGSIPVELGNLTNLQYLYLNSNQLTGLIPASLTNLSSLVSIDTRFNALYSNNTAVNDFINARPCWSGNPFCSEDWQYTQTQFPANIQVIASSDNSISLQWDETTYQAHGHYKIMMAENLTGPYSEVYQTSSKNEVMYTHGGLNPNQTYYFKLITDTIPHVYNSNLVTSVESVALSETTAASATPTNLTLTISGVQQTPAQASVVKVPVLKAASLVDISYSIQVSNDSAESLTGATFVHLLPDDLLNVAWTCDNETNGAFCPATNGGGNLNYLLDLPANSSMTFNITGQSDVIDAGGLIIVASIAPPDGYSDTDIDTNSVSVNLDVIYANGFEQ